MRWKPMVSRRILVAIAVACLLVYSLYALNSCLVSDVRNAVRRHQHALFTLFHPDIGYRLLHGDPVQQLPNALIIGVKKCGTRALLEFLRIHPDVRAARSEVHFFDRFFHRGFEWYRSRMPPTLPGQLTIEKTPGYWAARAAPARVRRMNREMRLLCVVRDPVKRAVSDYTQAVSKLPSLPPFESLAFVNGTNGSRVDARWPPLRLGVYARPLRRWLRRFPRSSILIVNGERLITDPAGEMARVQDFLGLKRVITEKQFYFNSTKGFPCLVKSEANPTPHCLGKSKGRSHPTVDPTALRRLRDFFRPYNEKFYQLAGVNFGWP